MRNPGELGSSARLRWPAFACAALLLGSGCYLRVGSGSDNAGGDLGPIGDDLGPGSNGDGGAPDMTSPADLTPAPDLKPIPDLGGWIDPAWTDPTGTRDLTSEGTSDWVHWGLNSGTSVDRRAGITPAIVASVIGSDGPHQYDDNHVLFKWSNGTPMGSTTGTPTGVFVYGLGNGFTITVPAEPTPHTLQVYLSAFGADYRLIARASDDSSPAYVDEQTLPGNVSGVYRMYTFTYKSPTPGAVFQVSWVDTFEHFGGANVTLQAAVLQ